ncbi:predicted protein [Lichtheimia corymbifera JMRC:FSU:9682]|uniref:Uncharacterized protein n=1 Tax=Lichtheimia corymbifera JMRC:FSU:9682 TaxID=1263082 RepID=A0A068SBV4_9FUNG|nr:predicted protein [Lichtheimia corymbifera JMRC:FSU:9682]
MAYAAESPSKRHSSKQIGIIKILQFTELAWRFAIHMLQRWLLMTIIHSTRVVAGGKDKTWYWSVARGAR